MTSITPWAETPFLFPQLKFPTGVQEKEPDSYKPAEEPGINEKIVKLIWLERYWDDERLATVDGRRIKIVNTGWWSFEGGPDFTNVSVQYEDGTAAEGEVEIHLKSSDWKKHGHHTDPRFSQIVLHVVLWHDTGNQLNQTSDGNVLNVLALSPYLKEPLEDLIPNLVETDYQNLIPSERGTCSEWISLYNDEEIRTLLGYAADARALLKSEKFSEEIRKVGKEQALYQAVFEAFGFKRFRTQLRRLASHIPLETFRRILARVPGDKRILTTQAVLFGSGGLIPVPNLAGESIEPDTDRYIRQLYEIWNRIQEEYPIQPLFRRDRWNFAFTRPQNYPFGRLAALGFFLGRNWEKDWVPWFTQSLDLFRDRPDRTGVRNFVSRIREGFEPDRFEFWSTRYTFTGKKLKTPRKLVGDSRVYSLAVDVLIPIFLSFAQEEKDEELEEVLHRLYQKIPKQEWNSITRFTSHRILSQTGKKEKLVTCARDQQGLQHMFHKFCTVYTDACSGCWFPEFLKGRLKQ